MPKSPPTHKPAHASGASSHTARFAKIARRRRGGDFYDTPAWRKLRKAYRDIHPLCDECEKHGRVTPSEHVDHVIPRNQRPDLELDWSNLRALCKPCHSRKTATHDGGLGNSRRP